MYIRQNRGVMDNLPPTLKQILACIMNKGLFSKVLFLLLLLQTRVMARELPHGVGHHYHHDLNKYNNNNNDNAGSFPPHCGAQGR